MSRARVVFFGTPEFAVPSLRAVAGDFDVRAVVTRPDRPRGRGMREAPSPVAAEAEQLGLPVHRPARLDAAVQGTLGALEPDLFAVVAYGAILSRELLAVPRLGSINLHASLLPQYRGASPIQRALWDGAPWTGVTTMWMNEGLDTGDRMLQTWTPIAADDDAGSLAERLSVIGAPLLSLSLRLAAGGHAPRHPQPPDGATYAKKLGKEDGVIDWALPVTMVWNRARAVTPWPGATTGHRGRRLLVTRCRPRHLLPGGLPGTVVEIGREGVAVACGSGVLDLQRVKPEGRSDMEAAEWARGARLAAGATLALEKETAA